MGYSRTVSPDVIILLCNPKNYNMDKNSEVKFIGQPILKQILDLLSVINLDSLIKKHQTD
jgi:hypothetical protein